MAADITSIRVVAGVAINVRETPPTTGRAWSRLWPELKQSPRRKVDAMFGVVRPCRHRLSAGERSRWAGHLCGLCLTLRNEVGHDARLATSYDGLLLSVLAEDLVEVDLDHRRAGPCPLRGMRTAKVVSSTAAAAQLAASVSLLLAAAKVADHVEDGQSPRLLRPLARRWEAGGRRLASDVGLDAGSVLDPVADQSRLEAVAGRDLTSYTAPTEAATSAAFAHVATITERPAARDGLAAAGAAFGRLAHLLDAVEDEAGDRRAGRFNPLAASGTVRTDARAVADNSVVLLRQGLAAAGFAGTSLTHRLLVHEAGHAVRRAFGGGHPGPIGCQLLPCSQCAEAQAGRYRYRRRRRGDGGGGCYVCCCPCCCPCDCCDCCDVCEI